MSDGLSCGHRECALRKLIVFIKIVSGEAERIGLSEDRLLEIGLASLHDLGVSKEEIALTTLDLVFGQNGMADFLSPLMGNVDNDSTVSTGE